VTRRSGRTRWRSPDAPTLIIRKRWRASRRPACGRRFAALTRASHFRSAGIYRSVGETPPAAFLGQPLARQERSPAVLMAGRSTVGWRGQANPGLVGPPARVSATGIADQRRHGVAGLVRTPLRRTAAIAESFTPARIESVQSLVARPHNRFQRSGVTHVPGRFTLLPMFPVAPMEGPAAPDRVFHFGTAPRCRRFSHQPDPG
jgi:hypothetical protein